VLISLVALFGISATFGLLSYALRAFFLLVGLAVLGLAFTWMLEKLFAALSTLQERRRRKTGSFDHRD
jgi:hypothetical protein